MYGIRSNDLVRLSVLESLWRAHSFSDLLDKISGCLKWVRIGHELLSARAINPSPAANRVSITMTLNRLVC
jgi:hypothetical protein